MQPVKYLQLHIFMDILKRFRKLIYQENQNTGHGCKYFCICWDILEEYCFSNNAW